MHEHFEGQLEICSARLRGFFFRTVNCGDLLERTFTRQDHEVAPEFPSKLHPSRAADSHLGGSVDREIRRKAPDEPANADILNNRGIHPGRNDGAQIVLRIGQLVRENQRVKSDIAPHSANVQKLH